MKACSTCAHGQVVVGHLPIYGLDKDNHPSMVECRFHAPRPTVGHVVDNFDRVSYPPLQAHDYWCGQWEPQGFKFTTPEPMAALPRSTAGEMYCRDVYGYQSQPQAPAPQEQIVTYDSAEDLTA